ncbi:addiction module antidote protein, HigA family [Oceanispirochaeta crateris]|jgi:addiction module HigA family antidote|uniref:Addiction module antidote protein, HigA family n=1 Tax=Oceanispirochaeta crateris TaxID=2518645 RepID=A0A5C1QLB6_9SPIO|nr:MULTISPECIES: HigA family addiction module antitoxin [Oceanispirochaeta]MDA3955771.1 HigA family addiction module antitoxin [Oceanispirochaeta sp.]QEN07326.1 addiction module antidote protein, HigA family [Oceanispirochaeta crateris]
MTERRKPVHPGNVIKEDILVPLGLTVTKAAVDLGVSRKSLSELINEKASLSPDMATRIAKATKTSPESWLNMQSKLDLWTSEQKDITVIPFPVYSESVHDIKEG